MSPSMKHQMLLVVVVLLASAMAPVAAFLSSPLTRAVAPTTRRSSSRGMMMQYASFGSPGAPNPVGAAAGGGETRPGSPNPYHSPGAPGMGNRRGSEPGAVPPAVNPYAPPGGQPDYFSHYTRTDLSYKNYWRSLTPDQKGKLYELGGWSRDGNVASSTKGRQLTAKESEETERARNAHSKPFDEAWESAKKRGASPAEIESARIASGANGWFPIVLNWLAGTVGLIEAPVIFKRAFEQ